MIAEQSLGLFPTRRFDGLDVLRGSDGLCSDPRASGRVVGVVGHRVGSFASMARERGDSWDFLKRSNNQGWANVE